MEIANEIQYPGARKNDRALPSTAPGNRAALDFAVQTLRDAGVTVVTDLPFAAVRTAD
jgi:hypothetical protein